MAKLILSLDGVVIRDVKLDKPRITIGRKPNNEVQIDNLAISGEHAVVTVEGVDVFVEDLGSTNGTIVNGQPVKKQMLNDNDLMEIGKYKLKFIAEKVSRPIEDFERTMVIRSPLVTGKPASLVGTPAAPDIAQTPPPPPPVQARPAVLQILNGSNAGRELELTKNLTTIGKTGVQVAVITRRPQGYFITHVDGPKHPTVNGQEIDAQAHPLNDHDVIELANIKMEFFYKSQV